MENSKLEKQNGALKIAVFALVLVGVAAASILGYHYYPVLFKDTEPWEKSADSRRDREGSRPDRSASSAPAPAAPPAQPAPANPAPQPAAASPQTEAEKFTGAWEFKSNAKGATYRRTYGPPRLENGSYVGDVIDENGANFAKYTVGAGNKLTLEVLVSNALNAAGEKNTYTYKFSNNDKTFTLSRNGGVLSTWHRE